VKHTGEPAVLEETRRRFKEILTAHDLLEAEISVTAKPLTAEEAIGNPERRDYPIIVGRERVMEAVLSGAKGHSFTDTPSHFRGTLQEVADLDLDGNRNRAVFLATLNATLRHLGLAGGTVHCKDEDPEQCAREIAAHILEKHGRVRVGLIGLNPAIAEHLVHTFGSENVLMTDLNADNIGRKRFGVEVMDGRRRTDELIDRSDFVILTGTTLVNGTFDHIWRRILADRKPYLVYGVTTAGVCALQDIDRICPYGRDE